MPMMKHIGYHSYRDAVATSAVSKSLVVQAQPETRFAYTFQNFFHP